MTAARRRLGQSGEESVARWYLDRGYQVLARNWRRREGELDLILCRGGLYVFCEVKARSSVVFGTPAEAVGGQKQARIRRLAAVWLAEESPGPAAGVRFDVACVLGGSIEVIEAAF